MSTVFERQEREALVADVGAAVDAAPRMSRARGPHSPNVVHAFVTSWSWAEPSAGSASWKNFLSRMPMPPPVTTRNRSWREPHDRQVGEDPAGAR